MKTYRNLKLIGSVTEQKKLINLIEQRLSDGWIRDREREASLGSKSEINYVCFTCSKNELRPAVGLAFVFDNNDYLYISNIVFLEHREQSIDEYNAILEEFLTRFVEPSSKGIEIEIRTTPGERTIDSAMNPELAQSLRMFSDAANKAGLHPLDEERFFSFIVKAYQEKSLLAESELAGLLIDDGWSEEQALKLSLKYRFGRDLLKYNHENKS